MRQGGWLAGWLDRAEARSAEAVAVVSAMVLVSGVLYVAGERGGDEVELDAVRASGGATPTPSSQAPVDGALPSFAPLPLLPGATPTASPSPGPADPVRADAVTSTAQPEEEAQDATRLVVLAVEAPTTVSVGETVVFRVAVRSSAGTPVLTSAQFGDGATSGSPAPCAGTAGPAFDDALEVSHTYTRAGTFTPYFVATVPCGPAAGAGATVTVTGDPSGPAGPSVTPSPQASPSPSGLPLPTGGPSPSPSAEP